MPLGRKRTGVALSDNLCTIALFMYLGLTLVPIAAGLGQVVGEAGVGHGAVSEDPSAGEHLQLHCCRCQQAG